MFLELFTKTFCLYKVLEKYVSDVSFHVMDQPIDKYLMGTFDV